MCALYYDLKLRKSLIIICLTLTQSRGISGYKHRVYGVCCLRAWNFCDHDEHSPGYLSTVCPGHVCRVVRLAAGHSLHIKFHLQLTIQLKSNSAYVYFIVVCVHWVWSIMVKSKV